MFLSRKVCTETKEDIVHYRGQTMQIRTVSLLMSLLLIASTSASVLAEENDTTQPTTGTDDGVICYNNVTHTLSVQASQSECESFMYVENYTMSDGTDICYNTVAHTNSTEDNNTCSSYSYVENHTMQDGSSFTGCYNSVNHATDANMSQEECEAYAYYVNYGATIYTGCYNMATHQTNSDIQSVCEGHMWTQAVSLAMTAGATTIHSTLVAALTAANLVDTLSGDTNYTVFAPTDEAFAAAGIDLNDPNLTTDALSDILLYHVVPGTIMSTDLTVGMANVTAANGDELLVQVTETGAVMVGSEMATVTIADVPASNGVIHVIDKVLTPPKDVETNDTTDTTNDTETVTCDATIGVSPGGYKFSPSSVSIEVGETVCWSWTNQSMEHNVKEVDGLKSTTYVEGGITSGVASKTVDFHHTFTEDTTFYYACEPHISLEMFGKVVVGDGGVEPMDAKDDMKKNETPGFLGVTLVLAAIGALLFTRNNRPEDL
jgi:uncharacterized surface protein with fasciclin (FAS1) repeats